MGKIHLEQPLGPFPIGLREERQFGVIQRSGAARATHDNELASPVPARMRLAPGTTESHGLGPIAVQLGHGNEVGIHRLVTSMPKARVYWRVLLPETLSMRATPGGGVACRHQPVGPDRT